MRVGGVCFCWGSFGRKRSIEVEAEVEKNEGVRGCATILTVLHS